MAKKKTNPPLARKRTRKQVSAPAKRNARKGAEGDRKTTVGETGSLVNAMGEPKLSRVGRPDMRRDPVLKKLLMDKLMAGNTYSTACGLARISRRVFQRWLAEGREAKEGTLAHDFYMDIRYACAQAEDRNNMRVQKGSGNWQSSAWFLERRDPENWGRKDVVKVGNEETGKPFLHTEVSEETISDEAAMTALKAVLEREGKL